MNELGGEYEEGNDLPFQVPYSADNYQYLKEITDIASSLPEGVRENFWGVVNQVHQLPNLDKRDLRMKKLRVRQILALRRIGDRRVRYTPRAMVEAEQVELIAGSMMDRALNGFERRMQKTGEIEYRMTQQEQRKPNMGLVGRLFGRAGK